MDECVERVGSTINIVNKWDVWSALSNMFVTLRTHTDTTGSVWDRVLFYLYADDTENISLSKKLLLKNISYLILKNSPQILL